MKAAAGVSTYIGDIPAAQRAASKKLRALCKQSLKGYEECIEYGVPSYKRKGVLEVSFASRKTIRRPVRAEERCFGRVSS
jgi:uncharacterized protein YdhG (YjbR/CyaY superfamily)